MPGYAGSCGENVGLGILGVGGEDRSSTITSSFSLEVLGVGDMMFRFSSSTCNQGTGLLVLNVQAANGVERFTCRLIIIKLSFLCSTLKSRGCSSPWCSLGRPAGLIWGPGDDLLVFLLRSNGASSGGGTLT